MNISLLCPSCGEDCDHEVIRGAHEFTVRCCHCQAVYKIPQSKPDEIDVRTVVSSEDHSVVCESKVSRDGEYSLGDVIVAECGNTSYGVEITGIEIRNRRVEKAKGSNILTLWTRAIEEVVVKVSIHVGRSTIPLYLRCDGEDEFIVDNTYAIAGKKFRISHMKLRDGRFIRKKGNKAIAMSIRRIYAFKS